MSPVAVLVNLNARRGSPRVGHLVREVLPRAEVAVTSSLDDARRFLQDQVSARPPSLILSGGGDGTAVAIWNELRAMNADIPPLGLLRLGTGNGLANVTGAPRARTALERIAALRGVVPPVRGFRLLESEGRIAPFAGTGWDAQIVADFKAWQATLPPGMQGMNAGLRGYLNALFLRTIPRQLFGDGPAHVRAVNLGDDAFTLDDQERVVPIPGARKGTVLYEGLASVASGATTTEWGFGFRAFPHAHRVPDRLSVRVYGAKVLEATSKMFKLWRGERVPKMHDFFTTGIRFELDREVPFQIGGDVIGPRRVIELRLSEQRVGLVDWDRLPS
ncbi:MAG: diacylglycerol kinase [Myxococcales bacterium]|nr:diacylglycerol kinase [Myxococcales bacterium]